MGKRIIADDGLLADEVGPWAETKHNRLCRYIGITTGVRYKFLTGSAKSATYIDLFCGSGRAKIKDTDKWIDGSPVAAWTASQESGQPFSQVLIADADDEKCNAAFERLSRLGAPVQIVPGEAVEAASQLSGILSRYGYHFAFIDPFSLGALNFEIVRSLATFKRMDMLIHISKMDHQRNLLRNLDIDLEKDESALDSFVPGWKDHIDPNQPQIGIRRQIIEYWQTLVKETGKTTSPAWDLITGNRGQHLYWLLLVAEHELAQQFWKASSPNRQGDFAF